MARNISVTVSPINSLSIEALPAISTQTSVLSGVQEVNIQAQTLLQGPQDHLDDTRFYPIENPSGFIPNFIPHNRVVGPIGVSTQSHSNFSGNYIYLCPVYIAENSAFNRIGGAFTQFGSAANVRLLIYDHLTGTQFPNRLILNAGTFPVNSAIKTVKELVISANLTQGYYFLGVVSAGTYSLNYASAGTVCYDFFGYNNNYEFELPMVVSNLDAGYYANPPSSLSGLCVMGVNRMPILGLRSV